MGTRKEGNKMKNEVATKTSGAVAVGSDLAGWGKREIRSTSIVIPRLLKMEQMSDLVIQQKAKSGEFRDSLSGEKVGALTEPFEIIPIEVEEKWALYDVIETKGKRKREFNSMAPVTAQNENWKYSEGAIERDRIMDVYCLLVSDIKALPKDWQERGLKPLPKILGFRRTSLRSGKQLYTQMYITNESKGLPPPATIMEVSGHTVDGDEGTYGVIDVAPKRQATSEEMAIAFHWFKAIKSGQIKTDDSEIVAPVEQPTTRRDVSEVKDY